jgi:EmrB/QacA subfamily drug resistance transporter
MSLPASETTDALFERYGPRYRWFATVTVLLGLIAAMVTTTTVNVAIHDIMGAFGISQDRGQWLMTGALAAQTVGMLLNAWLIRSFGQRRTFVGALLVFIAALLLAGAAPNDTVLIFCRIVQGGIAGLLQPLAVYTLYRVFPPNQKGQAMGYLGLAIIVGPALGPTLGGFLMDLFNWRAIFYIAVPPSAAALLLGSIFMPQREESSARADFDWLGFALLSVAVSCLLTGLSNGQREGWDSWFVLNFIGAGITAAVAFVAWELRIRHPLVELRVLASSRFAAAASVAFIMGVGLFGSVYMVPLFVESVQGYTPLAAGLLLMPPGLVMGVFMPIGGYLTDRLPAAWLIMTGLLIFALTCYWFGAVDVNTPFWTLVWWVLLGRIGLTLINPALNVAALRAVRAENLGQGAGMINFFRQLGGAFGVNLLSVILDRRTSFHANALASVETAGNSATAELLRTMESVLARGGLPESLQAAGALHYLDRVVYAQAYTLGFRDSFLICGIAFLLAVIPAAIMARTRGSVSDETSQMKRPG